MSKGDPNLPVDDSHHTIASQQSDLAPAPLAEVSRRSFLKHSGGAASAAALLALPTAADAVGPPLPAKAPATGPAQLLGPGAVPATLLVNGKPQKVMIEPRDTLAVVLRDRLGLLGTKLGCDRGGCGACTVWVSGTPELACMTLALDVAGLTGREPLAITTVEGLAKGATLHPLQQAFVDKDALQCGFCTSGMLMSCAALHEKARAAGKLDSVTEAEVRGAIAGNLCRCGAYPHIIDAALFAAKAPASPPAAAPAKGGAK
jgi:aerobic-type carbon monoxide dehydrogenase small subunit (CoxS/CutS family)